MSFDGNTWYTYLIYSLIALVAFLGNALVLYILVTRPYYLKHSYNIFLCNLAITDIITSIMLIFSRYLYLPPMPTAQHSKAIYCKTIWSGWILFTLGYISIYTCLVLTIDRWLAVVKPLIYTAVKPCHAVKTVALVWVVGITINVSTLFRVKYDEVKHQCTWTFLKIGNKEIPWLDFTLQSLIPFSCMLILYAHIIYSLRKLPLADVGRGHPLRKVTTVALATSLALIIGWLPSRVSFMLSKFGYLNSNGVLHFCLVMLAFFNSCVNPFLYGIYASKFKREYKTICHKFIRKFSHPEDHCKFVMESSSDNEVKKSNHLKLNVEAAEKAFNIKTEKKKETNS